MGSALVVATMLRPPSRATKTLPSRSAASSWVSARPAGLEALVRRAEQVDVRPARAARCARHRRASTRRPRRRRRGRRPPRPARRSRSDRRARRRHPSEETLTEPHTAAVRRPFAQPIDEVLRRPRPPPGRDDRLLRAALLRLADLPRAGAARLHRPRRRVELSRRGAPAALPVAVDQRHRPGRRDDHVAMRRRSGSSAAPFLVWTSLSLFSVLESAFNIVYGAPEPLVPARQVPGDASSWPAR